MRRIENMITFDGPCFILDGVRRAVQVVVEVVRIIGVGDQGQYIPGDSAETISRNYVSWKWRARSIRARRRRVEDRNEITGRVTEAAEVTLFEGCGRNADESAIRGRL